MFAYMDALQGRELGRGKNVLILRKHKRRNTFLVCQGMASKKFCSSLFSRKSPWREKREKKEAEMRSKLSRPMFNVWSNRK